MLIKSITIENFQSYYKTQTINFSKGLNLVIGKGGKGKSKLFNAFYWVLFGKIYITDVGWCDTDGLPQSSKGAMRRHEFINMKALADAKVGEIVTTGVRLILEDDQHIEHIIERSVAAKRLSGDDWKSSFSWEVKPNILKVSYDSATGTNVKMGYQAEDRINTLFPPEIRNYIWFQGESLESLIDFRDKKTLQDAVRHISYYPFYQRLSEIITKSKAKIVKMEEKVEKEENKNNAAALAILSRRDTAMYKLETEQRNNDALKEQIEDVQLALAEEETKLQGLASYTELVKKYGDCQREIDRLNTIIFSNNDYQREQLPYLWILRGIEPLLEKCKDVISNYTTETFAKPESKYIDNPSKAKLEEIIRDHQCFVCGAHVEEGNERYEWIMHRIQEQDAFFKEMEEYRANMDAASKFSMVVGRIQDYPDEIINALAMVEEQWQKSEDEIEDKMAKRRVLFEEKRDYDSQIEDIKRRYGVDPIKEASSASLISSNMSHTRTELDDLKKQLTISETLLSSLRSDYNKICQEAEGLSTDGHGVSKHEETEWKHISTFLEDICKRVQENARKDLLKKIESRANEFYAKFTEHDTGYKGNVKIDEDYTIEFDPGLNTSHEDRKKMSIINALLSLNQEAMNIYYPFISDAPTSNFDPETTHKYLLGIKDIFSQSIIMTKDVEVDGQAYEDLLGQENVSRIYELQSYVYCDGTADPELNEVSTIVEPLK